MDILKKIEAARDMHKKTPGIGRNDWNGIPGAILNITVKAFKEAIRRTHGSDPDMIEDMILVALPYVKEDNRRCETCGKSLDVD